MTSTVKKDIAPEEIIRAVKGMKKLQREAFLEDLLAATSPEYLASIREARVDFKDDRVKTHAELFRSHQRTIPPPRASTKSSSKPEIASISHESKGGRNR